MSARKYRLKPFVPREMDEQIQVFAWAKLRESHHPELKLLHANLNGLRLPIGLAVKAKKTGMALGVPDIFLPVPMEKGKSRMLFCGLYLELKRRDGGRLSEAQMWWIARLKEMGYRVEVPAGAPEAISIICDYLGIKP